MTSLIKCLRKSGAATSAEDKTELHRLVREDGLTEEESVLELIAQSRTELNEIVALAEKQGAKIQRVLEAVPGLPKAPTGEVAEPAGTVDAELAKVGVVPPETEAQPTKDQLAEIDNVFQAVQRAIPSDRAAVKKIAEASDDAFEGTIRLRAKRWLNAEKKRATEAGETLRVEAIIHLLDKGKLSGTAFDETWYDSVRREAIRKHGQNQAAAKKKKAAAPRGKKYGSTGEALRRWFDKQKAGLTDLSADSIEAYFVGLQKLAVRADLFSIEDLVGDNATPGLTRYLENLRRALPTFKEYANLSRSGLQWVDDTEAKRASFADNAKTYIELIGSVAETVQGHGTIEQAAKALRTLETELKGNKQLGYGHYNILKYAWPKEGEPRKYTRLHNLLRDEQKADDPSDRATPVRRARKAIKDLERTGMDDVRKGKNQKPDDLKRAFGFPDITVGNYVSSGQEQEHVNGSFEAFSDLASLIGWERTDMSFAGSLHYAIGALGSGRHAAHYSPNQGSEQGEVQVINVTNTSGDGTVAHEFGHAIDYNLRQSLTSEKMHEAIEEVVRRLKQKPHAEQLEKIEKTVGSFLDGGTYYPGMKRQGSISMAEHYLDREEARARHAASGVRTNYFVEAFRGDKNSKDEYWAKPTELFARAFEAYIYDRLGERKSEYLVTDWVEEDKVKKPPHRFAPYPQAEERKDFNDLFDKFIDALKWKDGKLTVDKKFSDSFKADRDVLVAKIKEMRTNLASIAEQRTQDKADTKRLKKKEQADKDAAEAAALREELKGVTEDQTIDEQLGSMTGEELNQELDDIFTGLDESQADQFHEQTTVAETEAPTEPVATDQDERVSAERGLAQDIANLYAINYADQGFTAMDNRGFFEIADNRYGGTRGEGVYESKDAYDAMELGVNLAIMNSRYIELGPEGKPIIEILERLTQALPTQSNRSQKQLEFQQFSTPPAYSYVVAWAANMSANDRVLEPSAGTGALLVHAKIAGASTIANELDISRGQLLEQLNPDLIKAEDGRYIGDILKEHEKPTVVLMNPPFSSDASGGAKNATKRGAQHVESALSALQDGGRLVAIVGNGMRRDRPAFKAWWAKIDKQYSVRAVIEVNGKVYRKYGTSFDNVVLVIDKISPTKVTAGDIIQTRVETLTELAGRLQEVRDARRQPTSAQRLIPRTSEATEAVTGPGAVTPAPTDDALPERGRARPGEPRAGEPAAGVVGEPERQQPAVTDEVDERGRDTGPGGLRGPEPAGVGAVGTTGVAPGDGSEGRDVSVGGLAKSAAKHGVKFSQETMNGLVELFGGPDRLRSFPAGIDEETYRKAKPYFERAYEEAVAAGKDLAAMIRALVDAFGRGMEPYLRHWVTERSTTMQEAGVRTEPQTVEPDAEEAILSDTDAPQKADELTDDVYETYVASRAVPGGQPHPADLSETAAMGDVSLPEVDYTPNLPQELIDNGAISDVQSEVIVMAGAAHSRLLPEDDGVQYRQGFITGDGTGLGKSRELLGIIIDNSRQGRRKALYISKNDGLLNDLRSDYKALGQNPNLIIPLSAGKIKGDEGILFTTYATLGRGRGAAKKAAATDFVAKRRVEHKETGRLGTVLLTSTKGDVSVVWDGQRQSFKIDRKELKAIGEKPDPGNPKLEQIEEWLGADFDGVMVFDEAHMMANSLSPEGGFRGGGGASEQALAGVALARSMPNARVVYATATAAQEVRNLAYMDRLGIWGPGTPFADKTAFVNQIESGGVAAMELVAKDLKALGVYLARNISYKGLTRNTVSHVLTEDQREIYDELARSWRIILNNIQQYMESTGADQDSNTRSRIASLIWSFQQRFFNQVITTMKMPSIIEDAKQKLADGHAVVFQLVNTGAAPTERAIARMEQQGGDLQDIDVSGKDDLIEMVIKAFPVQKFEEYVNEYGDTGVRPVTTADGKPIEDGAAVAARDQLVQNLRDIRVPEAPLDILINAFGTSKIAEVTGRSRRVVRKADGKTVIQPTPNTEAEIAAFQDGKKMALVFSDAGGTGKGYHGDLRVKNQARRHHYLIQAGWSATRAVQGFGRTHRSNQKQPPELILTTTDVQAEKRFTSSIARRLDQLGALTRGQRKTGGQGVFSAEDNLENEYAAGALREFLTSVVRKEHDQIAPSDLLDELGLNVIAEDGSITESRMPEIKTFLNRLLSVPLAKMDQYFAGFFERLEVAIETAKADGTYDVGVENLVAETVEIAHREVVYTDERTGADTEYVKFDLTDPVQYRTLDEVAEMDNVGTRQLQFFATNKQSGKIYAFFSAPTMTTTGGNVVDRYRRVGISSSTLIEKSSARTEGYNPNYEKVEAKDLRGVWDKEVAEAPSHRTWSEHMIVGAVLPVWDRLSGDTTRIYRTIADGERFIGRVIEPNELKTTLKNLGAGGARVTADAAKIIERVKAGYNYTLSNNWRLFRKRVGSEYRVEILGPGFGASGRLAEQLGATKEIIQSRSHYFATAAVIKKMRDGNIEIVDEISPTSEQFSLAGFAATRRAEDRDATGDMGAVETDLRSRLEQVGIADDVILKVVDVIFNAEGEVVMGARGRHVKSAREQIIEIAAGFSESSSMGTLNHEIIHALRSMGLIKEAEWRTLKSAARADKPLMTMIEARYGKNELSKDKMMEEAIASMHANWTSGSFKAKGFIRTAFERIRAFFEALGNAFRGAGFQSATDIFKSIGRGEVGRRGAAQPGGQPVEAFQRAFHGTRAQFDRFRTDKIGTGEGFQAFGYGLYFAQNKGVARSYRRAGEDISISDEKVVPVLDRISLYRNAAEGTLDDYIAANQKVLDRVTPETNDGDGVRIIAEAKKRIAEAEALKGTDVQFVQREGSLYEVEIPDEAVARMLDWDRPLSQQAKSVKSALADVEGLDDRMTGRLIYGVFVDRAAEAQFFTGDLSDINEQRIASESLDELGIPGIKYFDAFSRTGAAAGGGFIAPLAKLIKGKDTRNLVVFDDSIITIKSVDGKRVEAEAFALGPTGPVERKPVPAFENEESELRWIEARKGVRDQKTWMRRMADRAEHIAHGFSRHFINLPNKPRFSPAREQLRKIEAAPQASKEEVVRTLRQITKGMTREDMDLFTRKVVLDDLTFEVDQQHQLPFGFTPSTVKSELAKLDALIVDRPDIQEKIRLRQEISTRIANDLVDSGVLHKEQIKNPAYYRHQVLDYARAQVAYAKGAGKKLKTPHWARRMGSRLDINVNLLEAEFEWMQKALTDIATARTIEWFKQSEYNVRAQVIANAKAHNQRLVDAILEKDIDENGYEMKNGTMTSPIDQEWRGFKQRIAIGLSEIRKHIKNGLLTDIPGEFKAAADSLFAEVDGETSLFPFLAWILDNGLPGAMGAGMAFKAINQRKAWVRSHLGEKYADTMQLDNLVKRGFAPPGHMTWQPDEGRLLFTAKTIPEHVVDRMLERIAEEGAGGVISASELKGALESVRTMLAVGGPKYQMVLPEEVAKSLNSINDQHAEGLFDTLAAVPLSWWKRWVLINPRRVLKYNLNNLSGDLDAVIAGNPKAIKHMPRAIKELYQVMIQGKTPSPRYREAVDRGVFDSGLTIQEIPDINYMSEFEGLINAPSLKEPGRLAARPFMRIWRGLQRYTWFRENWLRYAAYLDYVERLEGGESMRSIGYGAAHRPMVDAVEDHKDRAALLARELVGDYGAISEFGKGIRRKIIPFYSWLEINTKRYWRLGANAWGQGIGQGLRTTGIVGATLGVRVTAYLYIRMAMLYGMVQLWNNLVMGDEEDELGAEARVRLHLILGRNDEGEIVTIRFQGALSDFLDWFGLDDAVGLMSEIERGRASYHDLLVAIAKAPVNKIVSGLTPLITTPIELLSGQSFWPDAFRPRAIRDKWQHLMRLFSVEHEYDLIFDRPSRGFGRSLVEAVAYRRDARETAYGRMKGLSYDWLRRERGQIGPGYQSPRSKALYNWRLAKRFDDREAERAAMRRMRDLGITNANIRSSIRNAHPLGGLSKKDRAVFIRTLSRREREVLKDAIAWYTETYID